MGKRCPGLTCHKNMEDRVHGDQETQVSSLAKRDNYELLGLLQDGPMSFAN